MTSEQLEQMTWEEFKVGVYDKYIPKSYSQAEEFEFYNLNQGRLSVTDYDRTFCDMSRYAPDQVDTDEKMAERFRAGLRHEITMALASHGGLTYPKSLSRTLDIEKAMPKEKLTVPAAPAPPTPQQQNSHEKRKWDGHRAPYKNKRPQPAPNPPQNGKRQAAPYQGGEYRPRTPPCAKCSKKCSSNNAGMGARQNYQGQRPQLQALQTEPREDRAPPQHPQQHHGYEKTDWEVEDTVEEN